MSQTVLNKMIAYFGSDVPRINHALKVYGFAQAIAAAEGLDAWQTRIVELTALLHDVGIPAAERKFGSAAGPYQEQEGPPIAREILKEANVLETVIDRVCFIIGHHHTYSAVDGTDFQIIIEADFLVNAFEGGMERPAIESVGEKCFRTAAGRELLAALYLQ